MYKSIEDRHYDFCLENGRPYLHYVCPQHQWDQYMTKEKLDELETSMRTFMTIAAKSDNVDFERIWELLPEGVSKYGLIDYVAIGDIQFGAEALHKLGYRPQSEKPPRLLSEYPYDSDDSEASCENPTEHDKITYRMYFIHPNKPDRPIYYEDWRNNDFSKLWYKMNELNK